MKSNATFHGAAMDQIQKHLVRYLSFIIFFLEQDGVINAYYNSRENEFKLFDIAKGYFLSRYDESYAKIEISKMYILQMNFHMMKFPLGKFIHEEFIKLRSQYVKILKDQAAQTSMNVKKISLKMEQNDEEYKQLTNAKKREFLKLQRIKLKDKELVDNITTLSEWIKIYSPQKYFNSIVDTENELYLQDFSYILQEQSQQSDKIGEITDCQNKFIEQSLRLFMKDKIGSKAQIYGVYWKIETPLSMVWKIISDILKQKGENSRY